MDTITTLENGISYEWVGRELLDTTVSTSVGHNNLLEDHSSYRTLLDFTTVPMFNPDQKYSSRLPNGGLKKVTETWTKSSRSMSFGPKKGMSQVEYWEKFSISYLMNEWTKKSNTMNWAPEATQAELLSIAEQAKDLVLGYDITYAEEMVKILTKWFEVTTAEGPGSASARDGYALFHNAHKLKSDETFSNLVSWLVDFNDVTSWQAKLQEALNKLKTMKFDNGKKIKQPKWEPYKLFCSRLRETYWLEVINNGSSNAWTWANSNKVNTFTFKNNLVQVVALDLLGDLDVNGEVVWHDDMWFVSNPSAIRTLQAFKDAKLYEPRVKTWENNETDEVNTSIRAVIGTGHYDAEFAIVGCFNAIVEEEEENPEEE